MNKYMIITTEGESQSLFGFPSYNCQVLGRIEADSKGDAIAKFWEENPEQTTECGFDESEAIAVQLHESEKV